MSALPQSDGLKLRLFQVSDPLKQWWSLDEMRFCARCEHIFTGRQIRLTEDEKGNVHFHCPTFGCGGTWEDWQYPELHL
jgi:hypothetical protein